MSDLLPILLPVMLLLGRTTAMMSVLPVFSWTALPMRVRAAMALTFTLFLGTVLPAPALAPGSTHWLAATLLLTREIALGLALGLAVGLVFLAVQQGGILASRQMGFAAAQIMDPTSGQEGRIVGMIFQMCFVLLFLMTGGHRMLLEVVYVSFEVFPLGGAFEPGLLAWGVLQASSAMLTFAVRLAMPLLAGFLILSVVLGVLARIAPEMNVLMISFPLRVSLGFFLASSTVPYLKVFNEEFAQWVRQFLFP